MQPGCEMNMDAFRISVVIPTCNCAYVGEALESVLTQSLPANEIVVIDSSDDLQRKLLKPFAKHISCYFQECAGVAAARNLGVKMSRGNFLAHLDGDDVWEKSKLEWQLEAFKQDTQLDIVGGGMQPFHSPELTMDDKKRIHCPQGTLPSFSASAILVRREAFYRVGFYKCDLRVSLDLDWFIRARELKLKEMMIPQVLVRRRLHKSNTDLLNHQYRNERLRVLKAALDRNRICAGKS